MDSTKVHVVDKSNKFVYVYISPMFQISTLYNIKALSISRWQGILLKCCYRLCLNIHPIMFSFQISLVLSFDLECLFLIT